MYLIFDTETTGLPKNWNAPITDVDNWPRCVQIAWQLHDRMGKLVDQQAYLIRPEGFNVPYDAEQVHGISTELAREKGEELKVVLDRFNEVLARSSHVVGQNVNFDLNIMGCEFHRLGVETALNEIPVLDTCTEKTAELCQIPGGRYGKFKLPTLTELHQELFDEAFEEAHNATADVEATARCFLELIRIGNFSVQELGADPGYLDDFKTENPDVFQLEGLKHANLKKESRKLKEKTRDEADRRDVSQELVKGLEQASFSHLHNHSQYSILQSTTRVADLVRAAADEKMPAVALTDTGNMMGAFVFVREILAHNKSNAHQIKPIVGCEFYVCENRKDRSVKDNGYQVVLLAKNKRGYHNLAKSLMLVFV